MIRIVVGGQINKQEIAAFTKNFMGTNASVDIKNDLDAVMAMQAGQYDYYIGACNTGGGGALAMAMALLGAAKCQTISMPGRISPMPTSSAPSRPVRSPTASPLSTPSRSCPFC